MQLLSSSERELPLSEWRGQALASGQSSGLSSSDTPGQLPDLSDLSTIYPSQEPRTQAAAVLLCHPGVRSVRGYGTVLSHDGFPASLRLLNINEYTFINVIKPDECFIFSPLHNLVMF